MVFETLHRKRLADKQIVIVTEYLDGDTVKRRSTDAKENDDVKSGVILDKKYYLGQKLVHQETEFNPGFLYSFSFPAFGDGKVICPNCGGVGEVGRRLSVLRNILYYRIRRKGSWVALAWRLCGSEE